MSSITAYLRMNNDQLAEEISKQKRKITSAQETISLLKKLQIAAEAISRSRQVQDQHNAPVGNAGNGEIETAGNA